LIRVISVHFLFRHARNVRRWSPIIELHSIEYARWGLPRTVFDSIKKQVTYDQKKDMDMIAFEIQLPQNAKRSFNADHSEYYWLLEAKVDIDDRRDSLINRVIHVA
jgi:hypothetical protein